VSEKIIPRKYWILLVMTPVVVGLDQLTKHLIVERFHLGETIPLILGFFNLTYIRNTGAAFGILAQAQPAFRIPFFVIVPVLALLAIGYIFRKISATDLKLSCSLSLIIGGAVGNLIDRINFGFVVDFLDFHYGYGYHFPAFNVADSAICVGVAILMLDLLKQDSSKALGEIKTNASSVI
jgi:signal peptidase II